MICVDAVLPGVVSNNSSQRSGVGFMLRVDSLGKAAECERAIEIIADPERRVVLNSLRRVWIALANKERSLGRPT
jgi:hypothetical protein